MSDRVSIAGLNVARSLFDFIANEALPVAAVDPDRFWDGFGQLIADFAPRNRSLLDRRNELQTIDRPVAPRACRPGPGSARLRSVPARDRLSRARSRGLRGQYGERRYRDQRHRRTATGGPDPERTLHPQCSERSVGIVVRRALRDRRHPTRRRLRAQRRLRRDAGRQGRGRRQDLPRPVLPAVASVPTQVPGVSSRGRTAGGHALRRDDHGIGGTGEVPRLRRERGRTRAASC